MKIENSAVWIQLDKDRIIRKEAVSSIFWSKEDRMYYVRIHGQMITYEKADGDKILKALNVQP